MAEIVSFVTPVHGMNNHQQVGEKLSGDVERSSADSSAVTSVHQTSNHQQDGEKVSGDVERSFADSFVGDLQTHGAGARQGEDQSSDTNGDANSNTHAMMTMGSAVTPHWVRIGDKGEDLAGNGTPHLSESTTDGPKLGEDHKTSASAPRMEGGQVGETGTVLRVVIEEASGETSGVAGYAAAAAGKQAKAVSTACAAERNGLMTGSKGGKKRKVSCIVDYDSCLPREVDLEKGMMPPKCAIKGGGDVVPAPVHPLDNDGDEEEEHVCRVCHISNSSMRKSADVIDLGCACKLDMGRAHRDCAETWFQVRGNRQCEICGETAQNVHYLETMNGIAPTSGDSTITVVALHHPSSCWQKRSLRTCVLIFLIGAFLVPWLFRFAYYR